MTIFDVYSHVWRHDVHVCSKSCIGCEGKTSNVEPLLYDRHLLGHILKSLDQLCAHDLTLPNKQFSGRRL